MGLKQFSLKSRLVSFKFAFRGFWLLLKNEHNSRIHLLAAIIAVITGILLKINPLEWSLLIIVIGLVFLAELLNTSLENIADIIKPEWNERIGNVKDYAAAAVLISAIMAVIVGVLIFIPKILSL